MVAIARPPVNHEPVDSVLARSGERAKDRPVIAYVDESLRLDGEGRYVLAAVLVPDARADEIRTTLRRGERRFHWHTARGSERVAAVAELGLEIVVATTGAFDCEHTERARRRCLRQLLWEFGERSVAEVVLGAGARR